MQSSLCLCSSLKKLYCGIQKEVSDLEKQATSHCHQAIKKKRFSFLSPSKNLLLLLQKQPRQLC